MNRGESPARMLLFSSSTWPAVAVYPDSDKVGVYVDGADDLIFKRGTAVRGRRAKRAGRTPPDVGGYGRSRPRRARGEGLRGRRRPPAQGRRVGLDRGHRELAQVVGKAAHRALVSSARSASTSAAAGRCRQHRAVHGGPHAQRRRGGVGDPGEEQPFRSDDTPPMAARDGGRPRSRARGVQLDRRRYVEVGQLEVARGVARRQGGRAHSAERRIGERAPHERERSPDQASRSQRPGDPR